MRNWPILLILLGSVTNAWGKDDPPQGKDKKVKPKAKPQKILKKDMPFWFAVNAADGLKNIPNGDPPGPPCHSNKEVNWPVKKNDKDKKKDDFDAELTCTAKISKTKLRDFLGRPSIASQSQTGFYKKLNGYLESSSDETEFKIRLPKADRVSKLFESDEKEFNFRLSYTNQLFIDTKQKSREGNFLDTSRLDFDFVRLGSRATEEDSFSLYATGGVALENRSNTEGYIDEDKFNQKFFNRTGGERAIYGSTNEYVGEGHLGVGLEQLFLENSTCRLSASSEMKFFKSSKSGEDRTEINGKLAYDFLDSNQGDRSTSKFSLVTGFKGEFTPEFGRCNTVDLTLDLMHQIKTEACLIEYGLGVDIPLRDDNFRGNHMDDGDALFMFKFGVRF